MNLSMPPTFPLSVFHEFAKFAGSFFPGILSDENLRDPFQKREHFQRAWWAVCYRYRACSEHNTAFNTLLTNTSDLWREWAADEEQNYEVEQCLYHFFMSGLSVFESLGFCLYFVAGMIDSKHFHFLSDPRKIKLKTTISAFEIAFPDATITRKLRELFSDPVFKEIDEIRNILAHRLTGRRHIRNYGSTDPGGVHTQTREEFWHIPGSGKELVFDEGLIQRYFDEITRLLTTLISASLEFAKALRK
jgi:hypothetical protein